MAAVVWTVLTARAYRLHRHGYMRRLLAMGVLTMVLWGLVLRGVTILGVLPDDVTQPLITGTIFIHRRPVAPDHDDGPVSTVAAAILGLFFWMWAHQAQHSYEERGHRLSLVIWVFGSVAAGVLMLWALIQAVTS